MTPEEKQSGIPCVLVGTDGNIYALLGRARQALRRGGRPDLVEPMTKEGRGSMAEKLTGIFRKPPAHRAAFFA